MENRLETRWRKLGGFWQQEEYGDEADGGLENAGDLEDMFMSISKIQKGEVQCVLPAQTSVWSDV